MIPVELRFMEQRSFIAKARDRKKLNMSDNEFLKIK